MRKYWISLGPLPTGRHCKKPGGCWQAPWWTWQKLPFAVQQDFTVVAQGADVHRAGMQVDATVGLMLVSAYHWSMLRGRPHTLSSHWSGRPTQQAFCGFFGIVVGGPPLTAGVRHQG
jgi:hypothetical protein